MLSPLLHANTRAKVSVAGSGFMGKLTDIIKAENIPVDIGGTDPTAFYDSEQEVALKEHVETVLREKNVRIPEIL